VVKALVVELAKSAEAVLNVLAVAEAVLAQQDVQHLILKAVVMVGQVNPLRLQALQ